STAVVDPTSGAQTEMNERGPEVTEAEVSLFCDKLAYLAKGADICVFAGSLPPGVDEKVYANLIRELAGLGVMTVVDADGDPMRFSLRAGPDIVSPNVAEAESLVGHEFRDEQDEISALRELCELGARGAIVTHAEGCHALVGRDHERRLYRVRTEPLDPVSRIGAGDAFLAGYLAARYVQRDEEDCLRFAVACGAESTRHVGAGVVDPREAEQIESGVVVEEIDEPARVDAQA
ncbi:hypothetical protein LCGC14_2978040, partial [marine sediment metagenome]